MIVCRNWFKDQTKVSNSPKILIFNLTGDRDATMFFKELFVCDFDVVIFMPNVGSENDRAGMFWIVQSLHCTELYYL